MYKAAQAIMQKAVAAKMSSSSFRLEITCVYQGQI